MGHIPWPRKESGTTETNTFNIQKETLCHPQFRWLAALCLIYVLLLQCSKWESVYLLAFFKWSGWSGLHLNSYYGPTVKTLVTPVDKSKAFVVSAALPRLDTEYPQLKPFLLKDLSKHVTGKCKPLCNSVNWSKCSHLCFWNPDFSF